MKTHVHLWLAMAVIVSGCGKATDAPPQNAKWEAEQQRIVDEYDRQAKRTNDSQDAADALTLRSSKLLDKQEEQSRRYDAILDAMEKQYGVKK